MAEIFWSAQNSDPKRKFRFQLLVDRIPVWVVKTVSKPSVTVNPVVHQYLNHEFRYPGRVTWDSPINVTLVDPLDPDLARTTLNMIRNAVEEWVLRNAFVSKITYGDLDYSSDDMSEITLEITYDWAELQLSHAPANGYSVDADKQQADADGVVRSSILT
jgi:hypothetical protein